MLFHTPLIWLIIGRGVCVDDGSLITGFIFSESISSHGRILTDSTLTESLVEQELCASAHEFLGSERSTWTGNVALEREAHGRRRNNFFGSVVGAGGKTLVELRSQVTRGREDLG